MSAARRKRVDRTVAAVIAVAVVVVGVLIYLTSDIRATESVLGPSTPAPDAPKNVPTALTQAWSLPTDPALGAVASPYGVVITTDASTVTAHDAVTGAVRWSYGRPGETLCAVGSGDTDAPGVQVRGKVRGVMAVSMKNGYCSQVMLLDPDTGERHYYRTSPNQAGGALAFGGPYAAWLGSSLVELWRDDLVRTIQYGDIPSPPTPNVAHTGCTFTDIALADEQFATVEHCDQPGAPKGNARVVLNWATPDSAPNKPDDQDVFKHDARADIDTGSPAARIVGITADRVAVLVSAPEPAVVVYDTSGAETSRTPVDIPAAAIVAADNLTPSGGTAPTPSVVDGALRYSLIGDRLLAVASQAAQVAAPVTGTSSSSLADLQPPNTSVPAASTPQVAPPADTVQVKDLAVRWTKDGALGLPAVIGQQLLMPVNDGLAVFVADNGNPGIVPAAIPVDRGGYTGRVDAAAVGSMIVETRGDTVVGLAGSG